MIIIIIITLNVMIIEVTFPFLFTILGTITFDVCTGLLFFFQLYRIEPCHSKIYLSVFANRKH